MLNMETKHFLQEKEDIEEYLPCFVDWFEIIYLYSNPHSYKTSLSAMKKWLYKRDSLFSGDMVTI